MTIVTLLSDFGSADTYVGQMKGALLSVAPDAVLVDLTHAIAPQDVRGAAFHLWAAVEAFPPGTVHLAVVDPGVGTRRRAIAARVRRGDFLVGPDNGLLSPALARLGGIEAAVEIVRTPGRRGDVSRTFHGRDIFAPAAGHLARGGRLAGLGPPCARLDVRIELPPYRREGRRIVGEVLHVDGYGNLVTNLPASELPPSFVVEIGARRIAGPRSSYQAVPRGRALALAGGSGLLELAVRDGSASRRFSAGAGNPVAVAPVS